jgi:hypothetical protein
MSIFDVCVTFTTSIFVIAYPILVEVISRLDEKYSSTVITDLFNSEWEKRLFSRSFYITIVLFISSLVEQPPFPFLPQHNWILNHSAILLLSGWTIFVTVLFVRLVEKIFVYYRQLELVRFLIRRHNSIAITDDNDFNNLFFSALSELLLYAIREKQEKIAKELSNFMYPAFKAVRDRHPGTAVVYPYPYYELIYAAIEALSEVTSFQFVYLQDRTAGSVWLLGEFANTSISDPTYSWIWQNSTLSLKNNRDDFVYMHWQHAHQYFSTQLRPIYQEHDAAFKITNQPEVDQRQKEREAFFYFHTALGALVLFSKKLETLKKIFAYTQSIPPNYVLLPTEMGEILHFYFKLSNEFDPDFHHIESRFPFPGFSGLNAGALIKEQFYHYLAVLLLRQYTIPKLHVYQDPLRMPAPPTGQGEKRIWIEHLPYFIRVVERLLPEQALLDTLGLGFITSGYCAHYKIKTPIALLTDFLNTLKGSFEDTEVNQEVSEAKRNQFFESSRAVLQGAFELYGDLEHSPLPKEGTTRNYIYGVWNLFDKSAFAQAQGVDYLNADSILAESLAEKFKYAMAESFYSHSSEAYLIRSADLPKFLDKLKIQHKDVVLVAFGSADIDYPGPELLAYATTQPELVGDCVFVLKKDGLPLLTYNDTTEELKAKYELSLLDPAHFLYGSVIDLNLRPDLQKEIRKENKTGDLTRQVLANIYINAQLHWRTGFKIVALKIVSPYREEGIINELDDIKPF